MQSYFRDIWKRVFLRGVHYRDSHQKLDTLYRIEDPWGMEKDEEQFRFRATNAFIANSVGRVNALLEIGCGEGHQSEKLLEVCDRLYGLDVSSRAVERAKQRCPQGTFGVGDIFDSPLLKQPPQFDLVVACEVLYYMKDVPAALARMSSIGKWCLVTYYGGTSEQLDSYFAGKPGLLSDTFKYESTVWTARLWPTESRQNRGLYNQYT